MLYVPGGTSTDSQSKIRGETTPFVPAPLLAIAQASPRKGKRPFSDQLAFVKQLHMVHPTQGSHNSAIENNRDAVAASAFGGVAGYNARKARMQRTNHARS